MFARCLWYGVYAINEAIDLLNVQGCKFLQKFIKSDTTDRCYFSVTQEGSPTKTQRTIFTESFYTIALSEMYRATGDKSYLVSLIKVVIHMKFNTLQCENSKTLYKEKCAK